MRNRANILRHLDWPTVLIYMILALMGWMNIYAASYNEAYDSPFNPAMEYGKQFIWLGLSLLIAFVVMQIEGDFYQRFAPLIYAIVILLLILVLLIGKEVNGAKAWFGVGSFGIQPSEFSKMATSLVLASYIAGAKVKFRSLSTRVITAAIIAVPAILILLQPDTGTVLVFAAFIFAMYREGLSGNILILGFGAIILAVVAILMGYTTMQYPVLGESDGIPLLMIILLGMAILALIIVRNFVVPRFRKKVVWVVIFTTIGSLGYVGSVNYAMDKVLKSHHKKRIEILLGLDDDPQGAGYNVKQSKTAIGSGGWSGKGFLNGPFTKYGFVPEQSTDFIFCTVGEEWGFIGSTLVILLFMLLILRTLQIAERQRSQFARVYGYCVASIFFFHLFINIGMVIGLAPVIGIPLPFFSYGGSALMGFTILLFIFLRLDAERLSVLR